MYETSDMNYMRKYLWFGLCDHEVTRRKRRKRRRRSRARRRRRRRSRARSRRRRREVGQEGEKK